jgi:hypothetical protein
MGRKPCSHVAHSRLPLDMTPQLCLDTARVQPEPQQTVLRRGMWGEERMPVQFEGLMYGGLCHCHLGCRHRQARELAAARGLPGRCGTGAHPGVEPGAGARRQPSVNRPGDATRRASCRSGNAERGTRCALVVQERGSARAPQRCRRRQTGAPDLEPSAPERAR